MALTTSKGFSIKLTNAGKRGSNYSVPKKLLVFSINGTCHVQSEIIYKSEIEWDRENKSILFCPKAR